MPGMRPTPARRLSCARLTPSPPRRLVLVATVLVGVACLGGCASRGDNTTAGGHTPGMTDYDNKMLFTDSPDYTKYDLH